MPMTVRALGLSSQNRSQLKVLRQVATTVGLDIMLGVVGKTSDALESMTNLERLLEAARFVIYWKHLMG